MKVQDIMTKQVVGISPDESVEVAARTLNRYNIGALPVCTKDGKLCGVVTDRDLVIRCVAAGRDPAKTAVRQIMTGQVTSVRPDMDVNLAAHLMGRQQIRRLPVTENGRLCGMVSLGDLAVHRESGSEAWDALSGISSTVSCRK